MKKVLMTGVALMALGSVAVAQPRSPLEFLFGPHVAPCTGGPTGSPDDRLRKGYIALDVSLEQKVLGRANLTAEHKAAEALIAAGQAGDWCKVHALQDVELARQKATETPEEQAAIAAFAHEVTDLANAVGTRLHEELQ